MLKPNARNAQPIPIGVLVSVDPEPGPCAPTLKRNRNGGVSWLWVATGGSFVWVGLLVVLAVYSSGPAAEQPNAPAPVAEPIAAAAPAPASVPAKPVIIDSGTQPSIVETPKQPKREVPVTREIKSSPAVDQEPKPAIAKEKTEGDAAKAPTVKRTKSQQAAPKDLDLTVFANCEEIGTNVLFVKNPPDAFKRAKAENKMVFMVHLSGNLEDPGFT